MVLIPLACSSGTPVHHVGTLMVGDSILYEARATVRNALGARAVAVHAVPGTAPCDMRTWLDGGAGGYRARLVVIETMGSVLTPCSKRSGPSGSVPARHQTAHDVVQLAKAARRTGARVLIVDPPPIGALSAPGNAWLDALTAELHRDLDGRRGISFTDAPRRSVAPDGRFVLVAPCRSASEPGCVDGHVTLRDPYFGVHLCPKTYADDAAIRRGCPVASPSALRYGQALVAAVKDAEGSHRRA